MNGIPLYDCIILGTGRVAFGQAAVASIRIHNRLADDEGLTRA